MIMASGGYPGAYEKGKVITGLEDAEKAGTLVVHAGTKEENGAILTNGGRVLGVIGEADDIRGAVAKAYDGVAKIHFEGEHHRSDIAHRALERLQK